MTVGVGGAGHVDTDELRALAENELKLNDAESLLLLQLCDELDALRERERATDTIAWDMIRERDELRARIGAAMAVLDAATGDHIDGVTVVRVPLVRRALDGGL